MTSEESLAMDTRFLSHLCATAKQGFPSNAIWCLVLGQLL